MLKCTICTTKTTGEHSTNRLENTPSGEKGDPVKVFWLEKHVKRHIMRRKEGEIKGVWEIKVKKYLGKEEEKKIRQKSI
jgi:hypothetical protein